jgi:SagB-type dehydrogenase family enzyme
MVAEPEAFRDGQPLAWTFHRGTTRWIFNTGGATFPVQLPGREHPEAVWASLPPALPLPASLGTVLERRVSSRAFAPDPVPLPAVATLLRSAYGIIGRSARDDIELIDRPVPSAGGLYPLEVSLLVRATDGLPPGVHHYLPAAHGLEQLRNGPLPHSLVTYLFMGQRWVADAALVMIVSAVPGRSLTKYGDRGYRYLLLEAGHVMQNVNLAAIALELETVNLGGFYDDELARLICVDPEHEIPLYATAVGVAAVKAAEDRIGRRALPEDLGSL